MVFALPVLILAGCSDSLIGTAPSPPTFATSNKALDKTLTPEQQKAAIADLQSDAGEEPGGLGSGRHHRLGETGPGAKLGRKTLSGALLAPGPASVVQMPTR